MLINVWRSDRYKVLIDVTLKAINIIKSYFKSNEHNKEIYPGVIRKINVKSNRHAFAKVVSCLKT